MIQNKPLSIGFIGGSIESAVGQTHQIACKMDGRWKLVSGCFSRQPDVNKKTAEHWGLGAQQTYGNWIELLESEQDKLDAIVILTPTPSHAEIIIKALSLGYAVICEKALTSSTEQAKQIADTLNHYKGFLAITYNYSGYPMVRELQALIQEGTLGKIQQIPNILLHCGTMSIYQQIFCFFIMPCDMQV